MALVTNPPHVPASQSPYQLDPEQTLRASKALLSHVQKERKVIQNASTKKSLLTTNDSISDEDGSSGNDIPIWLNLTTKQHIIDRNRLTPSKVVVPHPLNTSDDLSICIITTDPQRALKNVVADPEFPSSLSSRITKIIGLTKLKDRYKTFEQRRALLAEHDVFLADERIVTRLPGILGKIFYKATSKRPIPISIAEQHRVDGKRIKPPLEQKKSRADGSGPVASPTIVAKEIEKAVNAVAVNLKPGTSVATRVGLSSFTPEELVDNVTVVVSSLIDKHVVKGWRNVKAIHIKSPTSAAMPIWLADELWAEVDDIKRDEGVEAPPMTEGTSKRKRNPTTTKGPQAGSRKKARVEELKAVKQAEEQQRNTSRKERLAAQKSQVFHSAEITV